MLEVSCGFVVVFNDRTILGSYLKSITVNQKYGCTTLYKLFKLKSVVIIYQWPGIHLYVCVLGFLEVTNGYFKDLLSDKRELY